MRVMWRFFRPVALLIVTVACGLADGGTGAGGVVDGGSDGAETVQLDVTHKSEWRQLWIEGATDLPDGAYVNYRVTHAATATLPVEEWPAGNLMESGRAAVQDNQFWTRINTFRWPRGEVRIVVQFPLPPQPDEVMARYGEFGERLAGDNVTEQAGVRAVEVEHVFEHRP